MKNKNLLRIIVLCLLLVGILAFLRFNGAKEEKNRPAMDAPFQEFEGRGTSRGNAPHLSVEKIEKRLPSPREAFQGYDTLVVVTLGYKGQEPKGWKAAAGIALPDWKDGGALFFGKGAHLRALTSPPQFPGAEKVFYFPPQRNAATNKYEARFFMKLRHQPPSEDEIVLHVPTPLQNAPQAQSAIGGATSILGGASAPLTCVVDEPIEFTVRKPREVIKLPNVSRDPQVEVTRVEIRKSAPQKAENPLDHRTFDREIVIHSREKTLAKQRNGWGIVGIVDAQEKPIPEATIVPMLVKKEGARSQITTQRLSLKDAIAAGNRDAILKLQYWHDKDWPLELNISLRRNGKDLFGPLNKTQYQAAPAKAPIP